MIQETDTVGGEGAIFCLPDDYYTNPRDHSFIIYHHGAGENFSSLVSDPLKTGTVAQIIQQGWIVSASNAHGDNCGNNDGLTDYDNLLDYIMSTYTTTEQCGLWSQSLGGLSGLLQLAGVTIGVRSEIKSWLGTYPACSLQWMYDHGFSSLINTAFNIPGGGNYATQTSGHDPLLLSGSLFNKRMRFYAGPEDTVVTQAGNSTPMQSLVAATAIESTIVECDGEHGDPDYFRPVDYVDFWARSFGETGSENAKVGGLIKLQGLARMS